MTPQLHRHFGNAGSRHENKESGFDTATRSRWTRLTARCGPTSRPFGSPAGEVILVPAPTGALALHKKSTRPRSR